MKSMVIPAVFLLMTVPFVTSCTALRSATAENGGFASEAREGVSPKPEKETKTSGPSDSDQIPITGPVDSDAQHSWASRHIPGWKALAAFLPPPTDARMKWDEYYKSPGNTKASEQRPGLGY